MGYINGLYLFIDGVLTPCHRSKKVLKYILEPITIKKKFRVVVGGLFDFRVTPNPNFMFDVHLDVEFDKYKLPVTAVAAP